MKTRHLICLGVTLLASGGLLPAQVPQIAGGTTPTPSPAPTPGRSPQGFWQATLPGGNYIVSVERITSVSRHKYLLDGAFIVDEVTIDTIGQALSRFYFIVPVGTTVAPEGIASAIERGKGAIDTIGQRTGTDPATMVVKKYPDTTHARTIEYRIDTEAQLISLFESAREAWESGRGGQFAIQAK